MSVSFILLAGGLGSRIKKEIPKQFLLLAGKPVIMHTLERLEKIDSINEIIVVCLDEYKDFVYRYIDDYKLTKKYKIVGGGHSRQNSVFRGLKVAGCNTVIIHESARPFVTVHDFITLIEAESENVSFGVDIPFTVLKKDSHKKIVDIFNRESLVNIQLPQKFNKKLLLECHNKAFSENKHFTEDSSLMFHYLNNDIKLIEGKEYNYKLTTNFDLDIAESIYKNYMV